MKEALKERRHIELRPLTVACPDCESSDVAYSCVPDCCFNHVCSGCLKNFELFTEATGGIVASLQTPVLEKDSSQPTVACSRCQSLEVYAIAGASATELVCASCHTLLRLRISTN